MTSGSLPFADLRGQDPAVETLRHALSTGRVHHAYRFEGPEGVGKEKAALEFGARLIGAGADPAGWPELLRRVTTFSATPPHISLHPDLVLVERGLYQGVIGATETAGISVEQIRRVVLGRVGYPPHQGHALVILIRDADQLTMQAANALLKTLEEPGAATHFVLLTSRPKRLLDTVLSRTLPVRFGPLPDPLIRQLLAERGLPEEAAPAAQGSAAMALRLADPALLRARTEFVAELHQAALAPDLSRALGLADGKRGDRNVLGELLSYFAQDCAARARAQIATAAEQAERLARWHAVTLTALDELERYGSPALVLESMILRLRRI